MIELIISLGITLYIVLVIIWSVAITGNHGDSGFITYRKFKYHVDKVEWVVQEHQLPMKILKKKGLHVFDDSYELFIDNNLYRINGAYALPITPITMLLMNRYSRKKMDELNCPKIKRKNIKW